MLLVGTALTIAVWAHVAIFASGPLMVVGGMLAGMLVTVPATMQDRILQRFAWQVSLLKRRETPTFWSRYGDLILRVSVPVLCVLAGWWLKKYWG
jgi:hypothetical protein